MPIFCPVCAEVDEPKVSIRQISICGNCGASLVVDASGQATRAKATDTETMDLLEMQQLVRARASIARPTSR